MNAGHRLAVALGWCDETGIDFDNLANHGSTGEQLLADTIRALWTGRGGPMIADLVRDLDRESFDLVIHCIQESRPSEINR